jgi:ADP-ribosyl-[dinitrogen reductase] hydrolase
VVIENRATTLPHDRFRGALLGLACGDALGAPAEFLSKDALEQRFGRLTEMVGGGSLAWTPGEWTDDTGMALCVAEGILECPADPVPAIGRRFLAWKSTAKDVGGTVSSALGGFAGSWPQTAQATPQARAGKAAGNGSLMRTLPVALAYPGRDEMLRESARISAMTHWDPQAEVCCALYCLWARSVLEGRELAAAWSSALEEARRAAADGRLSPDTPGPEPLPAGFWERLAAAPDRHIRELQPTGYAGYVVDCLEAAVNRVLAEPSAEAVLVSLVNLGGETDTMAAVGGGVAGLRSGSKKLPSRWLDALLERQRIEEAGLRLSALRHRLVYAKSSLPAFTFGRAAGRILAGRNPLTDEDVAELVDQGVTAVLDLREELEWSHPGLFGRDALAALGWLGVERLNLPIRDGAPPRPEDFNRACAFLDRATAGGGLAYVHCRAGLERTGAVLAAYVARRHGLDGDQALERIRAAGWRVQPQPAQRAAVASWLDSS